MKSSKSPIIHRISWRKKLTRVSPSTIKWNRWVPTPGNIIFTLLIATILIFSQRVWANNTSDATNLSSNTIINYQGRLTAIDGTPKVGTYNMSFAIYDAANGENLIWGPENHSAVLVTDGVFNVGLGSQTGGGIPTNVWNGDRYLEITIDGETLSPREHIRSVPIASMALTVPDGAIDQTKAPFAPSVYHQEFNSSVEKVENAVIYSGWFHGSNEGYMTLDLSHIFTQVDSVLVTKTRTTNGVDKQVTFMVTDSSGTNKPTPSEIKIWAYDTAGNPASWIQGYVMVLGK